MKKKTRELLMKVVAILIILLMIIAIFVQLITVQ